MRKIAISSLATYRGINAWCIKTRSLSAERRRSACEKLHPMRTLVLVLGLAAASAAYSEQSSDSTGDYAMDLGQVYGAIQAVKFMKEICSDSFAGLSKTSEVAYQAWRKRHLPFLQEVEKHWSSAAWREAKGDPLKHMEFLNKMGTSFDQYKQGLRQQLSADGSDAFAKQCGAYGRYLTTDRTNIEYFYAEQVITMRRGAEKK